MKTLKSKCRRLISMLLVAALLLISVPAALAESYPASAQIDAASVSVFTSSKMKTKQDTLKNGDIIYIVSGGNGAIVKIRYNNNAKTGYIAEATEMRLLSEVYDSAKFNENTYVYKQAKTTAARAKVKKGLQVYVLATLGNWAKVEKNGVIAYAKLDKLTVTANAKTAETNTDISGTEMAVGVSSMNVYKSASAKSKKLGALKKGREVKLISTDDEWAYIELNGNYGYCSALALTEPDKTEDPVDAVVSVSKLNVYAESNSESTKLGTLKKGDSLQVLKWSAKWARVRVGSKDGYCPLSTLSRAAAKATPAPDLTNAIPATVVDKTMYVYKNAKSSSGKLATLKKGEEVQVIATSGSWAYIAYDDIFGFCVVSALKKSSEVAPKGYTACSIDATVVSADTKAYVSASTSATGTKLSLGQTVRVIAYNSSWGCIDYNGAKRYVPLKYLNHTAYTTVNSNGTAIETVLKALLSYGYSDNQPSTNYNDAAKTAIKRFQSACGLEQTGIADQTMQRILFSGNAPLSSILSQNLEKGMESVNVGRMQTRLYVLKYLGKTSSIDSDYGSTTASAVALFQKANGLSATGTADVKTLKKLYSSAAVSLPSGEKAADASTSSGGSGSSSGSSYLYNMPAGTESVTNDGGANDTASKKIEYVIYVAQQQLGKPYVYGSAGTKSFDCSGLTRYCFGKVGVTLAHSAYTVGYSTKYQKVSSAGSLRRGDLVFFNTVSDGDLCDHIGIYLGSGYFIHASSGAHKVVVSKLNGYYSRVFSWGRRVFG